MKYTSMDRIFAKLGRDLSNDIVNENDIVRVAMFDTCIIEVDAYLTHKFKGIVTEIATSANVIGVSADQVTNFEVKILILEDSYQDLVKAEDIIKSPFRPGMSATVDIQTETAPNIITVPIQAVTTRSDTTGNDKMDNEEGEEEGEDDQEMEDKDDDELLEYVFLYEDGKAVIQEVKTGIQDNMHIEIVEGLDTGQEIIVGPYRAVSKKLNNGDAVKKVDKKDLFKKD